MARPITEEEKAYAQELLKRAQKAQKQIENLDQATVDRAIQAVAWATANEKTFTRLAQMGVEESGLGDRAGRPNKRFKIKGVLRDALRQKSVGIVEEIPEKGLVKYAKPVGVVAALVPTTNPALTPPGMGIYALKARNSVVFSPHPRARQTTIETVNVMRRALNNIGLPEDIYVCAERPSIPLAQELMSICDLTIATGGPAMAKSAHSSGKPAYAAGQGNSTMVIDETADIKEAARNTMLSKMSDFGSGCSADGNLIVEQSIYDAFLAQLQEEGGYLVSDEEKEMIEKVYWQDGHRTIDTIACPAAQIAEKAGFPLPGDKKFLIVKEENIGREYPFSTEKLGTLLAIFKYSGFADALEMVRHIYDTQGKGHSCGIYSFNDEHIHQLALTAPVSRMMVRQPQSKANAGSFSNGMPMTSSMGCGVWAGNITNENISLKHYLNYTWVSRPIPEDRPSDEELFGEFYNTETW
ncbi:aldehyde dehydrogenase family protein [Desulforhopalus singaporensis]|uniref:Sulfoacetaldehyde dehydrogenase n=1 Tax=Desulforhopalus singaporensis TaxID=91360 RepID=A0A1H0SS36_9BACT|nr:aldehyde dehydrogenase family protein [Desulforhopalus singaporensis]SDP44587.1 sulfoacetaldehyde dehydrogenase [Desulforhopalus singaporensis]